MEQSASYNAYLEISIHALLAESDKSTRQVKQTYREISIHALLAESDRCRAASSAAWTISIHALLAESDCKHLSSDFWRGDFYPRSPCGERPKSAKATAFPLSFLSTLSLRRATVKISKNFMHRKDFYPRSPCGERLFSRGVCRNNQHFYPRSPCGERRWSRIFLHPKSYFYPRSPCGERPAQKCYHGSPAADFYPRSPCGERPSILHKILADWDFYPRSPCGERHERNGLLPVGHYFYPRSPCGERPVVSCTSCLPLVFLSTLSLRRATNWPRVMVSPTLYFYPRSPCGERLEHLLII